MDSETTHYDVLGIAPTAPAEVVRAAYRAQIRLAHPDAGGDTEQANRVNDAYAVLASPDSRAAYDRDLAARARPNQPSSSPSTVNDRDRTGALGPAEPVPFARERVVRWNHRKAPLLCALVWMVAECVYALTLSGQPGLSWLVGVITAALVAIAFLAGVSSRAMRRVWVIVAVGAALIALDTARQPSPAPVIGGLVLLLTTTTFAAVCSWAQRAERIERRRQDVTEFFHVVETVPGSDVWFVESAAPEPALGRTRVLLERLDSGARETRSLWGTIEQGDYLVLDEREEPLIRLDHATMAEGARPVKPRLWSKASE